MSDESKEIRTSNFASRLLSKAMSDRNKPSQRNDKLTTAEAAKYAVPEEAKEVVEAAAAT